ncbi:hsp70 family protein [Zavarzinella formosa]|uniref:hsp70 family protein n=1 Tax=Zavarzinella formosa TaxID=360055 RepID=UPI00036A8F78|nr:hsp70 family protein [Zavarzinella formosa]
MRYLVGIDLGTTNSALAYIDLQNRPRVGNLGLKTFPVPQLVAAGQMGERSLLPSFLYLPGSHDLPPGSVALPWNPSATDAVGEFARNHGSKIPGRLISSAKSWLCHPGVDRTAPLLPWNAPPEVPRLSPLEVSTRYLKHFVSGWNSMPKREDADHLELQNVVLTVPASFDDVARNLTMQAAKDAGLKNVTLLEEPQAAFYCWLGLSDPVEVTKMAPGMRCLVVDVGGGTSDFSLIRAAEDTGELTFIREAVGDHLLLGGDNMDLALAKLVETRLPQAGKLDAAQFGLLVQSCRQAKEVLLAPKPPASVSVTVQGRGRSVIGGAIHTSITPVDVQQAIFDGFFPFVSREAEATKISRGGLQEIGLPYVADAAVTRHLAGFLRRQLKEDERPDAILFNGGVFQPQALRDRLVDVMRPWYGDNWNPLILANPSLDLAVAWGAAYQGWLRHSGGKRIGGGIPRSYYIAVDAGQPDGSAPVLCVVPRRLEEGQEVTLAKPELELALGEPVLFPLFSSTVRGKDKPGDLLTIANDQLLKLPPMHTILRGGKRSGVKQVPVTLSARCTEIGTLELFCNAKAGDNKWRLEFNVRDIVTDDGNAGDEGGGRQEATDVFPEELVSKARELVADTFQGLGVPTELTKNLENVLETSRGDWPMGLCRRLWTVYEEQAEHRTRSAAHLNRWYHLVGFSLRPGFGDSLDRYRIDQLWKMLSSPPKSSGLTAQQVEGGADYWIMWRRVAGGLGSALQNTLMNRLRPILIPAKGKAVSKPGANELAEMWRAAASLERLDLRTKEALANALIRQTAKAPVPTYVFWSLTRIASRTLFYGPLNLVLHPQIVEPMIETLLSFKPENDSERNGWAFCLANMARLTGQRSLDVDEAVRTNVIDTLKHLPMAAKWLPMLEQVIEMEAADRGQLFGESLPKGLRLIG